MALQPGLVTGLVNGLGGVAELGGGCGVVGGDLGAGLVASVSDMCLLEPLSEETFLENLRARYAANQIYTYIGSVVISVNPYKKLPLYTSDVIFEYRSRNIYELPPHIYAIVDDAYRSMRDHNRDQCVIISGESGAGKTEASKVILQYVAAVSGKGEQIDRVKEQLLQSNPVLEAFGNAKTHRNDNSSRFGKYMDIEFDFKGDPVGGVITNYLLEKSRLLEQNRGERSFHIFYQLLRGAETDLLDKLKLKRNPEEYVILQSGGSTVIESVDDRQDYILTRKAMEVIGFSTDEVDVTLQLVAAVLKLGNIRFKPHNNLDGTDGCRLTDQDEVTDISEMLGCDWRVLQRALTQRLVKTATDHVKTDLSATEASYARDALSKALYSRLFTWLVKRINDSIKVKTKSKRKSMGVLDIYGFEIFEHNSFEQFIINYCNEKLQQLFIELTLKEEQDEYVAEGIEWINVDYFNNAVICDLIEKSNVGMLAMLDEECLRPGRATDMTFLDKLTATCERHAHFESRGCRKTQSDRSLPHDAFRLLHYAGEVTYKVEGFLDKNNDLLFRDLSSAMYQCRHPLLPTLFPEGDPAKITWRRPPTAGSQFKSSVGALMRNLLSKSPNYIRCIKPNDFKRASVFDETIVRHQVRYLGLMENVYVRRAGYAFRQGYRPFLARYKMLAETTWPHWRGRARDGVQQILTCSRILDDEYTFGSTKIFIANPLSLFLLEERRQSRLNELATLLQRVYRGWIQRQRYETLRHAQIVISKYLRGYSAKRRYRKLHAATLVICSYTRGWKARRLLRELRHARRCQLAIAVIHKFYLGWMVRREFRSKFRAIAGPKVTRFMQRALRYIFLRDLASKLPSMTLLDTRWPESPVRFQETSLQLRTIFHRWRCHRYRSQLGDVTRDRLREKAMASDIFKDKKVNYATTVEHPFRGDYVRLQQNVKWAKLTTDTDDQHLVFADIIMKVNRRNGKMVPQLLVVSRSSIIVLDQRSLTVKYRVPVSDVTSLSLSPFGDRLAVFHINKADNGDVLAKKGDLLLSSDHIIEIVTKLVILINSVTKRCLPVEISTQIMTQMNGHTMSVIFRQGVPDVLPGAVSIVRKGGSMEVLQC